VYILKNNVRDGVAKYYSSEGFLLKEVPFVSGKVEGVVKTFHPNGMVAESYQIVEGRRNGSYESYDTLGTPVTTLNFYNGLIMKIEPPKLPDIAGDDSLSEKKFELASVELTAEETALLEKYRPVIPPGDPAIYSFHDEPAKFLRGEEEFYSRLFYPSRAIEDELEGTVIVRALINTDGRVDSLEVIRKLGLGCDESAAITVQYTDFIPSKIKGRAVNSWVEIPVIFKLPKTAN